MSADVMPHAEYSARLRDVGVAAFWTVCGLLIVAVTWRIRLWIDSDSPARYSHSYLFGFTFMGYGVFTAIRELAG